MIIYRTSVLRMKYQYISALLILCMLLFSGCSSNIESDTENGKATQIPQDISENHQTEQPDSENEEAFEKKPLYLEYSYTLLSGRVKEASMKIRLDSEKNKWTIGFNDPVGEFMPTGYAIDESGDITDVSVLQEFEGMISEYGFEENNGKYDYDSNDNVQLSLIIKYSDGSEYRYVTTKMPDNNSDFRKNLAEEIIAYYNLITGK